MENSTFKNAELRMSITRLNYARGLCAQENSYSQLFTKS